MGRGRPAQYVALTADEKDALEALTRRRTAPQREVERARIALLAEHGESTTAIAKMVQVSKQTVSRWRGRAACRGKDGLADLPRSGHPARITEAQRLQLISLACEPAEADGRLNPTLNEVVDRAKAHGIAVSRSHLQHILSVGDLHPHKSHQWLHSQDPQFREKVNEICDLYHKPPAGSRVLSIDEKTGIQATERIHLDRPPRPGRVRRQEFEYIRHGTQALIAALDVHTGRTVAICGARRTQADLLAFMEQVAKEYPEGPILVVWDNLNTHLPGQWADFNRRHQGRFHLHFTPIHASWVNQVVLLLSVYSRRCLRHASHTSTAHLRERTLQFFAERNRVPRPFKWSFRGFQFQTGEPKRKPGRKPYAKPPRPCHRCRDPEATARGPGP
jgi:transposase